jgi:hypothetical protein
VAALLRPEAAALVAFIALSSLASAQEPVDVRVRVTTSAGDPLAEARIAVDGTPRTATTDSSGRALIRVTPGPATLVIRRIGFTETRHELVAGDREDEIHITLGAVETLPTVVVRRPAALVPALERRRSSGRGTFWGPEELAVSHNVRSILGRTRDVKLAPGALLVRFRHPNLAGECYADVYIDGVLTAPHAASYNTPRFLALQKFEELDAITPAALYALEVYPRASQAPPDIVKLRDGCGVILAWTRQWAARQGYLAGDGRPERSR